MAFEGDIDLYDIEMDNRFHTEDQFRSYAKYVERLLGVRSAAHHSVQTVPYRFMGWQMEPSAIRSSTASASG